MRGDDVEEVRAGAATSGDVEGVRRDDCGWRRGCGGAGGDAAGALFSAASVGSAGQTCRRRWRCGRVAAGSSWGEGRDAFELLNAMGMHFWLGWYTRGAVPT